MNSPPFCQNHTSYYQLYAVDLYRFLVEKYPLKLTSKKKENEENKKEKEMEMGMGKNPINLLLSESIVASNVKILTLLKNCPMYIPSNWHRDVLTIEQLIHIPIIDDMEIILTCELFDNLGLKHNHTIKKITENIDDYLSRKNNGDIF